MGHPFAVRPLFLLVPSLLASCRGDESDAPSAREVVRQYAAIARANYEDAVRTSSALQDAIDALTRTPSESTLDAARKAWLAAREPYVQSEAFRFYDGPIDDPETGPEGRINGWPVDEGYVDYIVDNPNTGIINDASTFPTLSRELIVEQNERGGEDKIAMGFHAIEFLLWGQDLYADGPGKRPYTDYVESDQGPGRNAVRRSQYVALAAELLTSDLSSVADAWKDGTAWRKRFDGLEPEQALKDIITGIAGLSGNELGGDRTLAAYDSHDQEDEHSCFSDNTHRDLVLNVIGIENVYLGRYGELDGPGIDELVRGKDPALDDEIKAGIEATRRAMQAIPQPFDQAIKNPDGRAQLKLAIDAVLALNVSLSKLPQALEL